MSLLKPKHFLLATLTLHAQAQPTTTFITQNTTQLIIYISSILAITALSIFIFYDRRHNYHYLRTAATAITHTWAALTNRIKQLRGKKEANQKLGTEDQISDKPTIGFIQTDKTYIEADLASIQQTANTNSSLPDELKQTTQEEPSAPVNLKQVFGKKEKKEGNRSRSKLKNRVQIKKSELEDEEQQEVQAVSQDMENSLDNSEG